MARKIRFTHFKKQFSENETIFKVLTNVISIENIKQKGKDLLKFVYLVNQKKSKINKIHFLDTTYLYRHYDSRYGLLYDHHDFSKENMRPVSEWENNESKYLKLLQIDYEIITWFHLVNSDIYKKWKDIILDTYTKSTKDHEFIKIVDEIVIEYRLKGNRESVIGFLLEECAGGLAAIELYGNITYPGPLNDAILYWVKKYNLENKFYPYRLSSSHPDLNNQFLMLANT